MFVVENTAASCSGASGVNRPNERVRTRATLADNFRASAISQETILSDPGLPTAAPLLRE
jgi:hypothetical protein